MANTYNLYIDDSGTRHPDRQLDLRSEKNDWFGLGGILVHCDDEARCREDHRALCAAWDISDPLHSEEIRHRCGKFRWLHHKTAFNICVERSAKYAISKGCKLNVFVEKSDKKTDRNIIQYYQDLKSGGLPFSSLNSAIYSHSPLSHTSLEGVLHDIKMKSKSSPMMQIADLYLYPLCRGGYDGSYHPYATLRARRRILDLHVDDPQKLGVKYSCFEYRAKTTEADSSCCQPQGSLQWKTSWVRPNTIGPVGVAAGKVITST